MICSKLSPSLWLGLVLFCLLAACDNTKTRSPVPSVAKVSALPAKPSYGAEVKQIDAAIERGIAFAAKPAGSAVISLEVVALYQERARLTGNYDDYAKAEALLASLAGPKPSASFCLAQARLYYTLHRLKQAGAALDSCPTSVEPTETASIRADLALYSGRYRVAESIYRALVNGSGTFSNYVRLGLLKKWLGSPGEAAALLEAAEKRYHGGAPVMIAWLKLQRGLVALDRGRFDEALAMYRLASDALDGWWLIDEHIAEALLLSGKTREARQLYENIIERTGNPEFMDALAAIEREAGREEHAKKLTLKARAIYEQRLVAFPEAAAGHALDHFLQDQADAKFALVLAQKNFETRPYGESAIALAKAWMLSGKPDRTVPLMEAQLAGGWDTAQIYWLLGLALHKLGQPQRAEHARAEALRRNPHSEKMYAYAPRTGRAP